MTMEAHSGKCLARQGTRPTWSPRRGEDRLNLSVCSPEPLFVLGGSRLFTKSAIGANAPLKLFNGCEGHFGIIFLEGVSRILKEIRKQ
jgi:hypothetical protein